MAYTALPYYTKPQYFDEGGVADDPYGGSVSTTAGGDSSGSGYNGFVQNAGNVVPLAAGTAGAVAAGAGAIGSGVSAAGGAVGNAAGTVANGVGDAAKGAWSGLGKGASAVGNAVAGGVGLVGGAMGLGQFGQNLNQYNLPQLQQYQDMSGQNQALGQQYSANAMGQQAPTINQDPSNQWRGQQGQLAQMLMNQANGKGPNLATQQLQNATDANIRNSMAMAQSMPGQSNMAAMRGAMDNQALQQQQAAGQAAQLRAQQQINAQGQLGNLLQGAREQDIGLAQQQAQMQQNQYGINNQGWSTGQNAAQGWANMGLNANQSQLQANIAQQQLEQQSFENAKGRQQNFFGGLMNGAGGALSSIGSIFAKGGEVKGYASGGAVGLGYFGLGDPQSPAYVPFGKGDQSGGSRGKSASAPATGGSSIDYSSASTGENFSLPSSSSMSMPVSMGDYASGGSVMNMLGGGHVPGKAVAKGDSKKNDTVPAMLSPGEIVLPRSVTQSPEAEELAKAFVAAIKAKKRAA